ncbi:hypothetical protein ACNKHR_07240 [Shigella flexneri]
MFNLVEPDIACFGE